MTRKTNRIFSIATLAIALAVLAFSCKKDEDPNVQSITIEREYFQYTPTAVTVSGIYAYGGKIDGIKMQVGQRNDLADARAFEADIDGTGFTVEVTGLQPGTEYRYCYEVDYGFAKPYKTETKTFATPADSPQVKTLEVMSLDSTTVRVKCEVVAEGGQEVTERGICWNTYGDPTLDDETMQHASGGTGQYTLRLNGLALGRKYYVKAYAKNASGIGFGEELEFETTAPPGMPVSVELSCDPEEGGDVSGGGTYMVGSQCTVTAVAHSGYTFVNWTENGSQVSTDATYTFDVTRECHLVAHFTTQAYIITAEVTPDNSGTVAGAGGYNYGEVCTLTATAKPGYEFVKWTKNGTNVSTNASFTFTVNASATYVAHFQTKTYTVSVSAQPSNGGSVTGGGTFNYGQSCTVHAVPAQGCAFINWTDDGDVVSTDVDYTFVVNGDRMLVAHFSNNMQTYTISVSANPTEGGTVSGGGTYYEGEQCTVTAVPANGYTFTGWWLIEVGPGGVGGYEVSVDATYTFTVTRDCTLRADFTNNGGGGNAPTGAINGKFTINANGDQVYFSKGNLQYIGSASSPYWKFADNQWDVLGTTTGQNSTSQNVDRDLFGWGTSGYNHGAVCYQPWSTSQTNSDYYAYGQYTYNLYDQTGQADWGYNAISNGGNQANQWRTLTKNEWAYVFNTRTTSSGIRYAKADVNGVSGVILLPNDWSTSYYTLSNTNNAGAGFNSNTISSTQWNTLEQHGAVFLPAAGIRYGPSVSGVGSYGYYWSASCGYSGIAYYVYFGGSNLSPQSNGNRYSGLSVRLVRSAQ